MKKASSKLRTQSSPGSVSSPLSLPRPGFLLFLQGSHGVCHIDEIDSQPAACTIGAQAVSIVPLLLVILCAVSLWLVLCRAPIMTLQSQVLCCSPAEGYSTLALYQHSLTCWQGDRQRSQAANLTYGSCGCSLCR